MADVTLILSAIKKGNGCAASELLPVVYQELRQIAARKLAQEAAGHTLQPTALVHEAYIRLVGGDDPQWQGRAHFFSAAAEAMRRILIDNARRKHAIRRGGGKLRRIEGDLDQYVCELANEEMVALDEALTQFAGEDPLKARLVELRFFAGMDLTEVAAMLGDIARNRNAALGVCAGVALRQDQWALEDLRASDFSDQRDYW